MTPLQYVILAFQYLPVTDIPVSAFAVSITGIPSVLYTMEIIDLSSSSLPKNILSPYIAFNQELSSFEVGLWDSEIYYYIGFSYYVLYLCLIFLSYCPYFADLSLYPNIFP